MTAIETLINTLEVIVEQHRRKAVITCAEDCWCWEIDSALVAYESEKGQYVRVRRDRLIKILPHSCGNCRLTLDCEVPIVTENNLYDLGGRTVTTDKEACIAHHIAFLTGADDE